ncbi:MAG: NAD(P)/FAD-dependent oxidoreductase [Planctomycetota bacterium]|jgi:predicted NAD/FAD-binding protein
MKIAIVVSGISGMTAAYLLHGEHDIELFEADDYVGGHTHTIDVVHKNEDYAVDTGFIVFNRVTYPNFCKIMDRLGVDSQPTEMRFSVKCERTGLEYSPHTLNTWFIQRKNILSASFHRMIFDVLRFRREINRLSAGDEEIEIGRYLKQHGYSEKFIQHFIIPLGSSLWSADPVRFQEFPLRTFARFFKNHGFLEIRNPFQWLVIRGGSSRYVEKLTAPYSDRIRRNCTVDSVRRSKEYVELEFGGERKRFDHVVIATHSDQALVILKDPSPAEREILGSIPYQENLTVLHTDISALPRHRKIWSSWNYLIPRTDTNSAVLTYDMNVLQSIQSPDEFCVTLNRPDDIDADKVIGRFVYHHPVFDKNAPGAQKRHAEISGANRTHYCGAYWGYGFHEDGVNSALAVCKYFAKGL